MGRVAYPFHGGDGYGPCCCDISHNRPAEGPKEGAGEDEGEGGLSLGGGGLVEDMYWEGVAVGLKQGLKQAAAVSVPNESREDSQWSAGYVNGINAKMTFVNRLIRLFV